MGTQPQALPAVPVAICVVAVALGLTGCTAAEAISNLADV